VPISTREKGFCIQMNRFSAFIDFLKYFYFPCNLFPLCKVLCMKPRKGVRFMERALRTNAAMEDILKK